MLLPPHLFGPGHGGATFTGGTAFFFLFQLGVTGGERGLLEGQPPTSKKSPQASDCARETAALLRRLERVDDALLGRVAAAEAQREGRADVARLNEQRRLRDGRVLRA